MDYRLSIEVRGTALVIPQRILESHLRCVIPEWPAPDLDSAPRYRVLKRRPGADA